MTSTIKEILLKRDLIRMLVIKDLKIRYSRPALGFFWTFLSPFLIVAIFYIVFSLFLKVKIGEAPFFLYLMSGIFPWRFFQDSLMCSVTSIVDNKNLVKESNFPHYLIPVSIVLSNAVNFLPSLVILIITSLFVLKGLSLFIVFLPIALIIHLITTMALAIICSLLYVKLRDMKYILETILLLLFYLTPIFYSIYLVKNSFSHLLFKIYTYNPLVGILNLYRSILLKGFYNIVQKDIGLLSLIVIPVVFSVFLLIWGFYLYKKNRNSINDYLYY